MDVWLLNNRLTYGRMVVEQPPNVWTCGWVVIKKNIYTLMRRGDGRNVIAEEDLQWKKLKCVTADAGRNMYWYCDCSSWVKCTGEWNCRLYEDDGFAFCYSSALILQKKKIFKLPCIACPIVSVGHLVRVLMTIYWLVECSFFSCWFRCQT